MPLTKSAKESQTLVEFSYGTEKLNIIRYTDSTVDLPSPSIIQPAGIFYSQPSMELTGLNISGIFEESPFKIKFQKPASGFLDRITNGEPHAPVTIRAFERTSYEMGETILFLFTGRVSTGVRNKEGKQGLIEINGVTEKDSFENLTLGMQANLQCIWNFGGPGCRAIVGYDDVICNAIAGDVFSAQTLPTRPNRYYHRGYAYKNGLAITIRDWISGLNFSLVRQPPQEWLLSTIRLFEGCDKVVTTCRLKGKEEQFMGLGYAMPNYNPNFESNS